MKFEIEFFDPIVRWHSDEDPFEDDKLVVWENLRTGQRWIETCHFAQWTSKEWARGIRTLDAIDFKKVVLWAPIPDTKSVPPAESANAEPIFDPWDPSFDHLPDDKHPGYRKATPTPTVNREVVDDFAGIRRIIATGGKEEFDKWASTQWTRFGDGQTAQFISIAKDSWNALLAALKEAHHG